MTPAVAPPMGSARWPTKLGGLMRQEMWGVFVAPWQADSLELDQANARALTLPQSASFVADPFYVAGDPLVVLAEQMDFARGYGRIVALHLGDDGSVERTVPVLDDGIHASYPVTYRFDDQTLLVPERGRTNRLEYYRYETTSATSELVSVALEGRNVLDPTIVAVEEHFYLFFTAGEHGIFNRLELFVSSSLFGPWEPHPATPISVDPARARCGGRFLTQPGGGLVRPAQNCVDGYGGAIEFQQVLELSPDRYAETAVASLRSDIPGYSAGLHTVDPDGHGMCVFDAKHYRSILTSPTLTFRAARRVQRRFRTKRTDRPVSAGEGRLR